MAAVKLDNPTAHLVNNVRVMGRHHDRGAELIDAIEQFHDVGRGPRVEVSGRLISNEDHRAVHERPCDRYALLFATGEFIGPSQLLAFEANDLKNLRDHSLDVAPRLADHLKSECDVLGDSLVRKQAEILKHGADLSAKAWDLPVGEPAELLARYPHLAACRPLLAQHEA